MMIVNWRPIYISNLLLCSLILILGIVCYKKHKGIWSLYVSMAFGLFGLSHLLLLMGATKNIENVLIIAGIRTLGYILIILSLCKAVIKK